MIRLLPLLAVCLALTACKDDSQQSAQANAPQIEENANLKLRNPDGDAGFLFVDQPEPRTTMTGSYLSGQFAQKRRDWDLALDNLQYVIKNDPENDNIVRITMVLKAGSGDVTGAVRDAGILYGKGDSGSLSSLLVAIGLVHGKNYPALDAHLNEIPKSALATFVKPVLNAWTGAVRGELNIAALQKNPVHIKHSILIADYLNQSELIPDILQTYQQTDGLTFNDQIFIADTYAHIGQTETAATLYGNLARIVPNDAVLNNKIAALKNNAPVPHGFESVASPHHGIAIGLSDIALILFQDGSEDSAKVFANLALYINKDTAIAHILLAEIAKQNEYYDAAITHLDNVPKSHRQYDAARRSIAELYELNGQRGKAIETYQSLADNGDRQALIAIGDLYRGDEEYKKAIAVYDEAEAILKENGTVPDQYWYLYYMRGMAHEQADAWDKAEADLKAALSYRPDNPYVLNYLGYAWADQGIYLDKALAMIEKAVALRPNDGYITDSLGWVYYKLGRYDEAVAPLERAVELMPYDPTVNDHLGDAYWKVGRRLEARFQWERAKNHSDDEELITAIAAKLQKGLPKAATTEQAEAH